MKILDKKEGGFYNNKILVACVFVLMILCFVSIVYGQFAVVWDTPKTGETIALSALTADNYTFVVNVTNFGLDNLTINNVTIYRRILGASTWIEWVSNTTGNFTNYNLVVDLNGTNALNGSFELNATANNGTQGTMFNSSVITVKIDTIKPVVSLANITNLNTTSTTIHYEFTATDYNLSACEMWFGNASNIVMVKNTTAINGTSSVTANVTNTSLSNGTYYFSVNCTDVAGNTHWNNTNTSFTVDSEIPSVNLINLSIPSILVEGFTYISRRGVSINITVNATDNFTHVKNVTVNNISISRDSSTSETWSKVMTIPTATPVQIIASDHVGNSYTNNTVTILFDDVAPVTTFANDSALKNETGWFNSDFHVGLSAANGTGGIAGVADISYRNGTSGAWDVWSANITFNSNLTSNVIQFRANDTIGNIEGYQTRLIKMDQTYPTVAVHSLSVGDVGISGNIVIAVNISDNLYGSGVNISTIRAWHNGTGGHNSSNKQTLTTNNGKYTGTLTAPSVNGSYIITVNVSDIAGNINFSNTTFTVNTSTRPIIEPNVANESYVSNNSVVTFTISGAANTYYNTSGSPEYSTRSTDSSISVTINANVSTTIVVEIHANKTDTNTTNKSFAYKVDNLPPPINFTGLTPNQRVNGTTTIRALSDDPESGTATVTFYIGLADATLTNMSTDDTGPYTYDWNTQFHTTGNYTINISSRDYAGNVNSTTIHVTINNTSPQTATVSSGVADFGGTVIEHHVPQISGLNSSTAIVTIAHKDEPFVSGGTVSTSHLTTKMYLNISADTAYESRVYFKLKTNQISYSDRNNMGVYMDHNEDGTYLENVDATYVNQIEDYYNFYFTTTNFSIFAIGVKGEAAPPTGGGGGGGGGANTYSIGFTSTPSKTGLKVGDKALFSFNKVTQSIEATTISANTATFKILPSSQTVTLDTGESEDIDLNGDGSNDLRLTLDYIHGAQKAFILVKNISKAKEGLTAFGIIDIIKDFYAGIKTYTAFEIIDLIREYYGGS